MAIQTADQWLAQQASASATPTPSKKKKKEENVYGMRDFLGEKLSFLEEPETIKNTSWIPDWKTGNNIADFVVNELINPMVRPM